MYQLTRKKYAFYRHLISKTLLGGGFLFILLSSYAFQANAQANFRPAYIITLENDTIHGLIDSRAVKKQQALCVFKLDKDTPSVKYTPEQIKAYRLENGKYFVSQKIKDGEEERTIFMEYIINGIADLFYYKGINGERYIIKKREGDIYEISDMNKI